MTPSQEEGWGVLLELADGFSTDWCLVGGQMVWIHALEQQAEPPRATEDLDVVVDVRTAPGGIRGLCAWLTGRGFTFEGINAFGVGHRYVRPAARRPGSVVFDILAPNDLGPKADLTTTPPARTLSAPGSRQALNATERVDVLLGQRAGSIFRPALHAAILVKPRPRRFQPVGIRNATGQTSPSS